MGACALSQRAVSTSPLPGSPTLFPGFVVCHKCDIQSHLNCVLFQQLDLPTNETDDAHEAISVGSSPLQAMHRLSADTIGATNPFSAIAIEVRRVQADFEWGSKDWRT